MIITRYKIHQDKLGSQGNVVLYYEIDSKFYKKDSYNINVILASKKYNSLKLSRNESIESICKVYIDNNGKWSIV